MNLYRVDPRECEVYQPQSWWPRCFYENAEERNKDLIVLLVNHDGDYTLPKEKHEQANTTVKEVGP